MSGRSVGRPTKYQDSFAARAREVCTNGATLADLANFFDVSTSTINGWIAKHPEFGAALDLGRKAFDKRVERALGEKAIGYRWTGEKVFVINGEIVRVETNEELPPDAQAAQFWLKNRDSENWRDRPDSVIRTGEDDVAEIDLGIKTLADVLHKLLEERLK